METSNTITRTITNLMTGEIRQELWVRIKSNIYRSPDGSLYTHGLLGWFCLDNLTKYL